LHCTINPFDARSLSRHYLTGSQNLYPAGLQEYGFIVDDSIAAKQYLAGYWANMWRFSSRRAATGEEAARCALR
jgi:hypothetical protein